MAEFAQTELWTRGVGGYHTYRIPALAVTSGGTVLAFCEGRRDSSSDTGQIDLLLRPQPRWRRVLGRLLGRLNRTGIHDRQPGTGP